MPPKHPKRHAKKLARKANNMARKSKRVIKGGLRSGGRVARKAGRTMQYVPGMEERGQDVEMIGRAGRAAGKIGGAGKKGK